MGSTVSCQHANPCCGKGFDGKNEEAIPYIPQAVGITTSENDAEITEPAAFTVTSKEVKPAEQPVAGVECPGFEVASAAELKRGDKSEASAELKPGDKSEKNGKRKSSKRAVNSNPEGPFRFKLQMDRLPGVPVGLKLDSLDGVTCFVDSISKGSVETWNEFHTKPGDLVLQKSDRIVSVNGCSGNPDLMMSELKTATSWELEVLRPREVTVSLGSTNSLGLDLRYSPSGNSLLLADLGTGTFAETNRKLQRPVKKMDRIIEVNGKRGHAKELLQCTGGDVGISIVFLQYSE